MLHEKKRYHFFYHYIYIRKEITTLDKLFYTLYNDTRVKRSMLLVLARKQRLTLMTLTSYNVFIKKNAAP